MKIKYNIEIKDEHIIFELKKIINQIYKLLPLREEGADWELPLSTIMEEMAGMNDLLIDQQDFFPLLCKLEGLYSLDTKDNFFMYRRTIFECLGLLNGMINNERN